MSYAVVLGGGAEYGNSDWMSRDYLKKSSQTSWVVVGLWDAADIDTFWSAFHKTGIIVLANAANDKTDDGFDLPK